MQVFYLYHFQGHYNQHSVLSKLQHDNYQLYKGARLFKPNLKEFNSITKNMDFGTLPESGFRFKELMDCELLLLTLGSKGMTLYDDDDCKTIATKARKVYDVSGAGDTVIASLASGIVVGFDPKTVTKFAATSWRS